MNVLRNILKKLEALLDHDLDHGRHIIRNFLKEIHFDTVIDLGAGSGKDLLLTREINRSATLIGIDGNVDCTNNLIQNDITTFCLDIEFDKLPFDDESIDIIIANQVLEHIKNIFWVFSEVSRCLKVDGYFIIGVPNLASFHNRLRLLLGIQPALLENYRAHIRGFTKFDMVRFMDNVWPEGYEMCLFAGSQFYPLPKKMAMFLSKLFPNLSSCIYFIWKKKKAYHNEIIAYLERYPWWSFQFYTGKK